MQYDCRTRQRISGNQMTSGLFCAVWESWHPTNIYAEGKSFIFVLLILNLWGFSSHTVCDCTQLITLAGDCQSHPLLSYPTRRCRQQSVCRSRGRALLKKCRQSPRYAPNEAEETCRTIIWFPHSAAPRHASLILHGPRGSIPRGSSNHWTASKVIIWHFKTWKVFQKLFPVW